MRRYAIYDSDMRLMCTMDIESDSSDAVMIAKSFHNIRGIIPETRDAEIYDFGIKIDLRTQNIEWYENEIRISKKRDSRFLAAIREVLNSK